MRHAAAKPESPHSLAALPGECVHPPLRLLERPTPGHADAVKPVTPGRPVRGWLGRLCQVLAESR